MRSRLPILTSLVVTLALVGPLSRVLRAGEPSAAVLLPATCVVFAEAPQPAALLAGLEKHPVVRRVMDLDEVRAALNKKEYLEFRAGVAIVESQMGMPWRQIVSQGAGGGVAVALDGPTQGVALVARGADETTQAKLLATLANLAALDAKNKGNADPVQTSDYRGVKCYRVADLRVAVAGPWLIATNNDRLGRQMVDRALDGGGGALEGDAQFRRARGAAAKLPAAWGYVNVAAFRDAGVAPKAFGGRTDNVVAEMLFGGILSTLQHTPFVAASLTVGERQADLAVAAPHDRGWAGDAREHFFGPQGAGAAPANLLGEQALLSIAAYRDLSAMWLRAGDLLEEKAQEELAKGDSQLTTLFGGKDFGEDILGALQPGIQIVAAPQTFSAGQPAPAIKLPAFALVGALKDPGPMQGELRRLFMNIIGFLNIVGSMDGQPQLELKTETAGAVSLVSASYLADPQADDPQQLKINHNFSPSIAFAGDRFVLATTKELATTLAAAEAPAATPGGSRVVNTRAVLEAAPLAAVLADNREHLVAQNMLEEGHTRPEAERAIDVLMELVGWLDQLELALETTGSELRATLSVALKPAP